MKQKTAIVTDSNSGITQDLSRELGIFTIPMPFIIDGETYYEDISLTQEEFYARLGSDADIATSQPAAGEVLELWDKVLEDYDALVHIPMSSGLSGACATAAALAHDYDGRVAVVNNQRISVTQRQAVMDALELAGAGKSAAEKPSAYSRRCCGATSRSDTRPCRTVRPSATTCHSSSQFSSERKKFSL